MDSETPADDDAVGPGASSGPFGGAAGGGEVPPPYQPSRRNLVQWKRYAALEADLVQALDLSPDQVCREVGGGSCVRDVHLVPLGGNEPYVSGLMVPPTDPLATTPTVVDRVLLSACSTRARLDAEGEGKVFSELNFDAPLTGAHDPTVEPTVRSLYQRLLARDPEPFELSLVAKLAEGVSGSRSAQEFAALSCFAIGSTTEFLFF